MSDITYYVVFAKAAISRNIKAADHKFSAVLCQGNHKVVMLMWKFSVSLWQIPEQFDVVSGVEAPVYLRCCLIWSQESEFLGRSGHYVIC